MVTIDVKKGQEKVVTIEVKKGTGKSGDNRGEKRDRKKW